MPRASDIAAVIPNWNGAPRLAKLLPQLAGLGAVLVVDNGSTDDSSSVASGATWIPLGANYGFAKAVNRGIERAPREATHIAILNNDITLGEGFFEALLAADADIAAPRLLRAADPTRIDGAFDLPAASGAAYRAGAGCPAEDPEFLRPRDIFSAPMTAALFRRSLFDEIGLLDETFGSYLEDVDFGIRCALAGRKGRYVPQAVAWHEGSATLGGAWSAGSTRWISRNQVLLARKYGAKLWPAILGQGLWGLLALRHGVGGAWLQGKIEGIRLSGVKCHQTWHSIVWKSEREIYDLQQRAGFDWYWRQYFHLHRRGSSHGG